jgi:hypothetical protein
MSVLGFSIEECVKSRPTSNIECYNTFECLSMVSSDSQEDNGQGLILHPAVVSLLVEYCSTSPHIISRLARTCKLFSKVFPYSANMLNLGDWIACFDFCSYNIIEVQKIKKELSLQLIQTRNKSCLEGYSWEFTLLSPLFKGETFLHCGVAHLNPRELTLWMTSENGKSRGDLGLSLDIFQKIRTKNELKACISSHLRLARHPTAESACQSLLLNFPDVQHQHWFCKSSLTLFKKLSPVWDDKHCMLRPFLSDRTTLVASCSS